MSTAAGAAWGSIGAMPMPAGFEYRTLFLHGRPRHEKFDDFWRRHPPMDTTHRAKIFSAFDALAGFDERIAGKEVLYCDRRYLSEEEKRELDEKLSVLRRLTCNSSAVRKNRPVITVSYFSVCMDPESFAYGTGGTYETVTGICRKVDDIAGTIRVDDITLPLEDVTGIDGSLFESIQDEIP